MPKRRVTTAKQKAAARANLAKARKARKPVSKEFRSNDAARKAVRKLKTKTTYTDKVTGETFSATRNFRGVTIVNRPFRKDPRHKKHRALTGTKVKS